MNGIRTIHILSVIPDLSKRIASQLTIPVNIVNIMDSTPEKVKLVYNSILPDDAIEKLQDAEIVVMDNNLMPQVIDKLPDAKWVQGTWAGVDHIVEHVRKNGKPKFPVSSMAHEQFSQLISEYVLCWVINLERSFLEIHKNQLKNQWLHTLELAYYRSVRDLTIGILGTGHMGSEIARGFKAFNACVHGLSRTKPNEERFNFFDKIWIRGELTSMLEHCDYLVSALPCTSETDNLLNINVLQHAKKSPVFINVGRGNVISEENILNALDSGFISGAVLDVFNPEPLAESSKLWLHPKVIVTPHLSAVSRADYAAACFAKRLPLFLNGMPFDTIDWDRGY